MDRISSKTPKMITLNIFFLSNVFSKDIEKIYVWRNVELERFLMYPSCLYCFYCNLHTFSFNVEFLSILRFFNKFLSSNSSTQHFHHIWQIKRFQDTSYPVIMESSTCVSWIRTRMREKLCVKNKLLRGLRCSILLCLI